MKKIGLLTTLLVAGLLLTGCNKTVIENPEIIDGCVTVDGENSCAVDIDEPVIEEFNIENYINGFAGTILNGTEVNVLNITGDYTLYHNDKFGFAVILGENWKGGKVELKTHNEQFGENAISRSLLFYKEGLEHESYMLSIDKIERYESAKKHDEFWTEEDFEKGIKGKNNKYYFMGYVYGDITSHIDTTNEYQQIFPDGFISYNVE